MSATVPHIMSWPLEGIDAEGRLAYSRDDDSIREVIRNILLTRPGERLRRPAFGAGITEFIHMNNNVTTRKLLADVVHKSIQQWEPRVVVESVEALPDSQRLSTVHLVIRYRMRHTRSTSQLELSLDLDRL